MKNDLAQHQQAIPAIEQPSVARRAPSAVSLSGLLGMIRIVVRRMWTQRALMLAIAAGYIVAIALVVSIPVYAEAVGYRVLRDELTKIDPDAKRPPFAFFYRYLGGQYGLVTWAQYTKLDTYMRSQVATTLGLPIKQNVRYVASDKLPLLTPDGAGEPLLWISMAFASDFDKHIQVTEGRFPQPTKDGPVEVLVTEGTASKLGLQVGEQYLVLGPKDKRSELSTPVKIVGVWQAKDPDDPYWFYRPDMQAFDETLITTEQSFVDRVAARNPNSVYVALWYIIADGSSIRSANSLNVLGRIQRTSSEINELLSGARLELSPASALQKHQQQVQRLTLLLSVLSIPIVGLIIYFVVLLAGLLVQRHSGEIVILRSRGASRLQVFSIALLEAALVGVAALILGAQLGKLAAWLMTWTRSFLDVTPSEALPIEMVPEAWSRAAQMLVLLIAATVIPSVGAARDTIVSFKSQRARDSHRPLWQRFFLDILLLIPVYYGYQQLRERGTIAFLGDTAGGDPFSNPLLLLTPALYIFTLALVTMRFFPLLMRTLAWIWTALPGIAAVTALRYLSRTTRGYTGPLLLLVLTLSLATFTSSLAATLDTHLYDQVYYESGGDMRLSDLGESTQTSGVGAAAPGSGQTATTDKDTLQEAQWLFLPVTDYLGIPGVRAATRVSRSEVEVAVGSNTNKGQYVGIDRLDFPNVTHWRADYADESLGALMNRLADDPASVLVDKTFAGKYGVRVGDKITLTMHDLGDAHDVPMVVAGYINLFPTAHLEDGPIVVGNLDYAFDQQGSQYPYEVWLRLADNASRKAINDGAVGLGLKTFDNGYAPEDIITERARPERQGLFGLLSVGFVAAAFLTVLGFLFYTVLSFQRRYVEFGMLRAIGLSTRQLAVLLAWEQALIVGIGALTGTLIGVSASRLFIPFLQVRAGKYPQTPPFIVRVAWSEISIIYAIFGALLLLAVLAMLVLLRRMRLFQAVKLGETV